MDRDYKKNTKPLILVILFSILAGLLIWLAIDLKSLHKSGVFNKAYRLRRHRYAATAPIIQPGQIQGWMTFRYVNYVCYLPVNYLSNKLNITDRNYPNITLDKYASLHKTNGAAFVELVRQAVASYPRGK